MYPARFEYHAPASVDAALALLERYGDEGKVLAGGQSLIPLEGADAVVVATMGHGDEELLAAALESGAGYVGLVASSRRAAGVLTGLRDAGLDEEAVLRVRAPAGLDLGPSSQEEIAVAILAELVAWRHTRPGESPVAGPAEAVDPVCGMTVAVEGAAERLEHEGAVVVFCSAHCRRQFEAEPERYGGLRAS